MFVYLFLPFILPIFAAYLGWERIAVPRFQLNEYLKGNMVGFVPLLGVSLAAFWVIINPGLQASRDPMCVDCGLVVIPFLAWLLGTVLGVILFTSLSTSSINKIVYGTQNREHRKSYLLPPLFFIGFIALSCRVSLAFNVVFELIVISLLLYLFLYVFINYRTVSRQPIKVHQEEDSHANKSI